MRCRRLTVASLVTACVLACFFPYVHGCSALQGVDAALHPPLSYVDQDRNTFDAVSPLLRSYAKDHPDAAPAVDDKLAAWQGRLDAAAKGAK